jgi:hypothetical protein
VKLPDHSEFGLTMAKDRPGTRCCAAVAIRFKHGSPTNFDMADTMVKTAVSHMNEPSESIFQIHTVFLGEVLKQQIGMRFTVLSKQQ